MKETVMLSLSIDRLQDMIKDAVNEAVTEHEQPGYQPDQRISRKQLRELYGISYPTIHQHMQRGLPFEKCGRKTLFRRAAVDEYFAGMTAAK